MMKSNKLLTLALLGGSKAGNWVAVYFYYFFLNFTLGEIASIQPAHLLGRPE